MYLGPVLVHVMDAGAGADAIVVISLHAYAFTCSPQGRVVESNLARALVLFKFYSTCYEAIGCLCQKQIKQLSSNWGNWVDAD